MIVCDVLIIGNGLTALTMAQLLHNNGISTIVMEKNRKSSEVWLENNKLEFKVRLEHLFPSINSTAIFTGCTQFVSAWSTTFSDTTTSDQRINFNKVKLLHALKSVRAPTAYSYHHIQSSTFRDHHWEVVIQLESGKIIQINSTFIVDASGRNAIWASRFQSKHIYTDDHICVSAIYQDDGFENKTSFCIETMENGWWYMIQQGALIQCSFITSPDKSYKDYPSLFDYNLSRTYYMKGYVQNRRGYFPVWVQDARTCILYNTSGHHWLAIGDAACTTDPLCGQGNEIVLDQVYIAIEYLQVFFNKENSTIESYDKQIHAMFFNHQKQLKAYYQMEKRWPQSAFWI